ncbi:MULTISPECIES: hypothetical protein [Pandoraea]|uniref:hypothetical protein n=1 Tax=Pandoraea TaxID=93217 RepID=UPI001FE477BE|nr:MULTISPECIES: hypothetical protein [Pandoraea]
MQFTDCRITLATDTEAEKQECWRAADNLTTMFKGIPDADWIRHTDVSQNVQLKFIWGRKKTASWGSGEDPYPQLT